MGKKELAAQFGISRTTLWRLEQKNADLKKTMEEAGKAQEILRNEGVEDTFLKRLLTGTAGPTEYMFYLCNRIPHRWKNKHTVEHSGEVKGGDKITILLSKEQGKVLASRTERLSI